MNINVFDKIEIAVEKLKERLVEQSVDVNPDDINIARSRLLECACRGGVMYVPVQAKGTPSKKRLQGMPATIAHIDKKGMGLAHATTRF